MRKIYTYIIFACLVMGALASCKPDYPYIEYEGDPGKVEFDNIESAVPIQVAISDPLFESYTRGIGAFDQLLDGTTGDDNWKNADIYVYAFYSPDGMLGTPKDYNYGERMDSKDEEKIFCLVDDTNDENIGHGKRARLNRDMTSFLQWKSDNMVYYSRAYPQYRYKFFAYHADDAFDASKTPNRRRDHVSYDVRIDGTQDLMCGYATPTPAQLAQMSSTGSKHVLNNINELAYSTETGHQDLFPVFQMEHQLALVKFYLKADSIIDANGNTIMDPEVEKGNVRIKNVIITAPYHGEFVVAANDESKLGVTFTNETKELYIPVKVGIDADGNPKVDSQGRRITVSRSEKGRVMAGNIDGFNPNIIPVAEEKEIGMGFLLPPAESYELKLDCHQYKIGPDGKQEEVGNYTSTFPLRISGDSFKAGHKYEVCIKVYGQRNIDLSLGDIVWKDGGDISFEE